MSESKIEINQRKIRKGKRLSDKAQQKQMWDKLSTPTKRPPRPLSSPFAPLVTYKTSRSGDRNVWYYPSGAKSKTFYDVEINEWVK